MSQSCTSEPVSWLTLERRALGELDGATLAEVDAHLASCGVCAACARQIAEDRASERIVLRPLPVGAAGPGAAVPRARRAWVRALAQPRWAALGPLLALAAAMGLWWSGSQRAVTPPPGDGVKGAAVALTLVGPDGVARAEVRPGEALMVRVSCVPAGTRAWDVVVYDGDGASFPLAGGAGLTCGNDVVLPGALSLDGRGGDATVCVVLDAAAVPARAALQTRAAVEGSAAEHACTQIRLR